MNYNTHIPVIHIDTNDDNKNLDTEFSHLSQLPPHQQINNGIPRSPNNSNNIISVSPNLTNTTFTNSATASPVSFLSINSNSNSNNNNNNNNNNNITNNNNSNNNNHNGNIHFNSRPMSMDFTSMNLNGNELPMTSPPRTNIATSSAQPQLGIKNRHRAGTFPSRFPSSATGNLLSPPTTSNTQPSLSLSPSMNPLGDSSIADFSTPNRLRSNSYQNTIWSSTSKQSQPPTLQSIDQYSPLNYPTVITPNFVHTEPSMLPLNDTLILPPSQMSNPVPQQLSQPPVQQLQLQSANRVRSFSTNNAISNHPDLKNYYLQQFLNDNVINEENENENIRQLLSAQQLQQQQQQQQLPLNGNSLKELSPQMSVTTPMYVDRPRAQTYTNGVNPLFENMKQQPHIPVILLDNVPHSSISFVSTFQDATLAPSNTVILVNLPNSGLVTAFNFHKILCKFGVVTAVRIVNCNNGDLICLATFETIEEAVNCKLNLNNQELIPGVSCIVAFAKILEISDSSVRQQDLLQQQQVKLPLMKDDNNNGSTSVFPEVSFNDDLENYKKVLEDFKDDLDKEEFEYLNHLIKEATQYKSEIGFGPLPEPSVVREFDSPKLRVIRKDIESNKLSQLEVEELALAMIQEIPELASDYLGNTIVQKLFEICSPPVRDIMILKLSPYLSQMGVHKNGTWAAQKLMTTATTAREKNIIGHSLKPYCSNLFNDQFGNYVLQCVLKFGSPWNDFITELILLKFLDISKGRFGARAIRACLESGLLTRSQTVAIAAAIVANCNNLATNVNGSLLIAWFLDTFQSTKDKPSMLLEFLIPNLLVLCTHKLGSLTILKILNHRNELEARNVLLKEIFGEVIFNDESTNDILPRKTTQLLHDILSDNVNGVTFIHKLLSIPSLKPDLKQLIIQLIRVALIDLNVPSYQGYKRLLEEVGLKSIGGNGTANDSLDQHGKRNNFRRPNSAGANGNRANHMNGYFQQQQQQQQQQFYSMDQFYHQKLMQQQQMMQPNPQNYVDYFPQQIPQLQMYQQQQRPYQRSQPQMYPQNYQQQQQQQNDVIDQLEQLSLQSLARGYSDSPISQQNISYI